MKAVVCKEFGPPEKLVIEEVEGPHPGPGRSADRGPGGDGHLPRRH